MEIWQGRKALRGDPEAEMCILQASEQCKGEGAMRE